MHTRRQERSLRAYERVRKHKGAAENPSPEARTQEAEFKRFAKSFPALIQACGLAQAVAFAQPKAPEGFLDDLESVMKLDDGKDLCDTAREAQLTDYLRLSRDALDAATWLKRYAEALLEGEA
ncbi:MAG: type III-B CRISPR module-associated protein Cmr5 [Gammaproteobacteria bacterium]